MLRQLEVRDLGVLERASLTIGPQMTVVTGETGAGKTLLVEALQLVLGGRADPGLVRPGATEAIVTATFEVEGRSLELSRTVAVQGRSKASIDGVAVTVGDLRLSAGTLLDIHGQHDAQSLFLPDAARRALDRAGGIATGELDAARAEVATLRAALQRAGGSPAELEALGAELAAQLEALDRLGITDLDELEQLEAEIAVLGDLDGLREVLGIALGTLDGDGDAPGALDLVGSAMGALAGRSTFGSEHDRLRASWAELGDLTSELRRRLEDLDLDPQRLEEATGRLATLKAAARRFGGDLAGVLKERDRIATELAAIEGASIDLEGLGERLEAASAVLARCEAAVLEARQAAAPVLAASVRGYLSQLGMAGARFEVVVGEDGAGDEVSFWFSANAGMRMAELARSASGGELSRAMLALRLSVPGGPPTMVFDEVDAGVGGAAALDLGQLLARLGQDRQVLVVTHLAQVAAYASTHLLVSKDPGQLLARTEVQPLTRAEREVELARMLSGFPDSATARAHARELLGLSG